MDIILSLTPFITVGPSTTVNSLPNRCRKLYHRRAFNPDTVYFIASRRLIHQTHRTWLT